MAQGPAFGDLQGGITLAGGVTAALFHRERTGHAPIVDSSLLAQGMWAVAPDISAAGDPGRTAAVADDSARHSATPPSIRSEAVAAVSGTTAES